MPVVALSFDAPIHQYEHNWARPYSSGCAVTLAGLGKMGCPRQQTRKLGSGEKLAG